MYIVRVSYKYSPISQQMLAEAIDMKTHIYVHTHSYPMDMPMDNVHDTDELDMTIGRVSPGAP